MTKQTDLQATEKILERSQIKTNNLIDPLTRDGFIATFTKKYKTEDIHNISEKVAANILRSFYDSKMDSHPEDDLDEMDS